MPFASITRRVRTFNVYNFNGKSKQATRVRLKHSSDIGYTPVGPYRVNIFAVN